MVDKTLLARKVASVRDAVARIRSVLPEAHDIADRTTREVVVLNLFVALQECVSLAAHWLADEGLDIPQTYGELFRHLGEHSVVKVLLNVSVNYSRLLGRRVRCALHDVQVMKRRGNVQLA